MRHYWRRIRLGRSWSSWTLSTTTMPWLRGCWRRSNVPSPGLVGRVERFKRAVLRLIKVREMSKEEFLSNPLVIDATERNFQVAIEALLDVGSFIISKKGWPRRRGTRRSVGSWLTRGSSHSTRAKSFARWRVCETYLSASTRRWITRGSTRCCGRWRSWRRS
ncbi:MAG: hypothetical protein B7L53_00460 [Thermofilum sp. NZ13]|nr:MAG: hypothetical protein B7L53_00460 [Thermofilum sp. NZ13]